MSVVEKESFGLVAAMNEVAVSEYLNAHYLAVKADQLALDQLLWHESGVSGAESKKLYAHAEGELYKKAIDRIDFHLGHIYAKLLGHDTEGSIIPQVDWEDQSKYRAYEEKGGCEHERLAVVSLLGKFAGSLATNASRTFIFAHKTNPLQADVICGVNYYFEATKPSV